MISTFFPMIFQFPKPSIVSKTFVQRRCSRGTRREEQGRRRRTAVAENGSNARLEGAVTLMGQVPVGGVGS